MDAPKINDSHRSKTILVLSLVSTILSLLIIIVSSTTTTPASALDVKFLRIFAVTMASVTIVCSIISFIAELSRRRRRKHVAPVETNGVPILRKFTLCHAFDACQPKALAWAFFLLAIAWIVHFCLLLVVPGAGATGAGRRSTSSQRTPAAAPRSTPDAPRSTSSWNFPVELCLAVLEVVALAAIAGINRVRHCQRLVGSGDEFQDIEMPTVEYCKEPPPVYKA